jgi:hypothetical protein
VRKCVRGGDGIEVTANCLRHRSAFRFNYRIGGVIIAMSSLTHEIQLPVCDHQSEDGNEYSSNSETDSNGAACIQ